MYIHTSSWPITELRPTYQIYIQLARALLPPRTKAALWLSKHVAGSEKYGLAFLSQWGFKGNIQEH